MAREALHSSQVKIEQKRPIIGDDVKAARDSSPDIVRADQLPKSDYMDELAFNEEPVTIRIEPSAEKNAANVHPFWVNGKGAEILIKGVWREVTFLPVGQEITIKRKYLAVMAGTKSDAVHTKVREVQGENPENTIDRFTSAVLSFSIIRDENPRGIPWLTELRRRNF